MFQRIQERLISYILTHLCAQVTFCVASNSKGEDAGLLQLEGGGSNVEGAGEDAEDDKIQAIVRAFQRLPQAELEHIGINLDVSRVHESSYASLLKEAWVRRQADIKRAMDAMVKPAEHMTKIVEVLKEVDSSADAVTDALRELESFVTDVDNARDFHQLIVDNSSAWKTLGEKLYEWNNKEHRMYAAWIFGTAVKNDYDYQLWTLETAPGRHPTRLDEQSQSIQIIHLLVSLLAEEVGPSNDELHRRALYAISSAIRGNPDVQEAIALPPNDANSIAPNPTPAFLDHLHRLSTSNLTTIETRRKIWNLVADMLEERYYTRVEMLEAEEGLPAEVLAQIESLKLLGDELCVPGWGQNAVLELRRLLDAEMLQALTSSSTPTRRSDAEGDVSATGETGALEQSPNPDTAGSSSSSSSVSFVVPLRATLSSLVTVVRELSRQCPHALEEQQRLVQMMARQVASLRGDANEVREGGDLAIAFCCPLNDKIQYFSFSSSSSLAGNCTQKSAVD